MQSFLSRMSWDQFLMWAAFSQIEPWGEVRADLRSGIIASTIANVNRDPKRSPRSFKPSDFMPKFGADDDSGGGKGGHKFGKREPLTDRSEWSKLKSSIKSMYGAKKK